MESRFFWVNTGRGRWCVTSIFFGTNFFGPIERENKWSSQVLSSIFAIIWAIIDKCYFLSVFDFVGASCNLLVTGRVGLLYSKRLLVPEIYWRICRGGLFHSYVANFSDFMFEIVVRLWACSDPLKPRFMENWRKCGHVTYYIFRTKYFDLQFEIQIACTGLFAKLLFQKLFDCVEPSSAYW